MREIDPLVHEFQHDVHRPRADEALHILKKIASLVKPIMRQRNWKVETLCEFFPEERNLLGLNVDRGKKICLRLRYPGDHRQFLPIEEVTDTMLHELCHNVWGPHDENFHALWNQLRDEHEALIRKGYTGEGFLGAGRTLGGSGRIPRDEAKRRARAAAEKRRQLSAGSGQKLGGRAVQRGEDIRRIIADAAQRRITITRGCASQTEAGDRIARDVEHNRNGFRTKAEEDDANERAIMLAYIDLIQEEEKEKYGDAYVPPSASNPAGMRATMSPPPNQPPQNNHRTTSPPPVSTDTKPSITAQNQGQTSVNSSLMEEQRGLGGTENGEFDDMWSCSICTLVNPGQFLACDVCGTERPSAPPSKSPRSSTQATASARGSARATETKRETPNALKPRLNAYNALKEMDRQEKAKPTKPLGWLCHRCGNWMEQQWWTCAACGEMKLTS
ncbi:MAG: hypothetical protein Q9160_001757 [Pyrenula sp. 1 TL-2023]